MILAIDVGNTNMGIGLFNGDKLAADWRLLTDHRRTSDEYAVLLRSLLISKGFNFESIKGIIISCVVPSMLSMLADLCKRNMNLDPVFAGPDNALGMNIRYENPGELGVDRIVNSVAAFEKYRRSLIVIDFGTATTFDYISPEGDYMGGAIAPGISIYAESLYQRTSKLPLVDFACPERVVATNTAAGMQAGIVFGYVSLVDGIVGRMKSEVKTDPLVVATGGLVCSIATHAKTIDEVDEYLTLRGLKIIFDNNRR